MYAETALFFFMLIAVNSSIKSGAEYDYDVIIMGAGMTGHVLFN